MRPRVLHELSRHLAIQLESGIQGGSVEIRIPVYLCHPLEALEGRESPESGQAAGVLYLYRVSPDSRLREGGIRLERGRGLGEASRLRFPGLWLRLRYAFLVVGGTLEDELVVLAAALRCLHDRPFVEVADLYEEEDEREGAGLDGGILPLAVVDEPMAWREIGLDEHRLAVSFEVCVPVPSDLEETVEPILERDLKLEHPRGSSGKGAP